jgi:hypothetical protein
MRRINVRITQIKCDGPGCEQIRGASNHWFWCYSEDGFVRTGPFNGVAEAMAISKHFCGLACLTKHIHNELSTSQQNEKTQQITAKEIFNESDPL